MINELSWQSLVERRRIHRLTLLYQIQRGLIDVNPGSIVKTSDRRTRGGRRIYLPTAIQPVYKYSLYFYPRTIQYWNRLPASTTAHHKKSWNMLFQFGIPTASHRFISWRRCRGLQPAGPAGVGGTLVSDQSELPRPIKIRPRMYVRRSFMHCRKQVALSELTCRFSPFALWDLADFG